MNPEFLNITEAVYASGSLVPQDEYMIYSTVDGILVQSHVRENQSFSKGQVLFSIETNYRQVQERLLAGIYETSLNRSGSTSPALRELDSKLSILESRIKTDSIQFMRAEALIHTGAISRSEWERAELQYTSSVNEWKALSAQRENLFLLSKLEAQQAENQYKTLQSQNREGQIRGFMDGVIYEIFKKNGERVSINEPIGLAGTGDMWMARLTIDERDFHRVAEGQRVIIQLDAYPGRTFTGVIQTILPRLNRAEQSFYAEASLEDSPENPIYGLNLEGNIIIRSSEKALTIPRQAILKGDSVKVVRDGKIIVTGFKPGISNMDRVEVLEGIHESDKIFLN